MDAKRVNYSNIEGRLSKSSLDRTMINSSHLDSHNGIIDPSDLKFIGNKIGHCFERSGVVFDRGWFDDHLAIEIAKHPFGSTFSAIDRNDAKVFRSDDLNSLLNRSGGFADVASFGLLRLARLRFRSHPSFS